MQTKNGFTTDIANVALIGIDPTGAPQIVATDASGNVIVRDKEDVGRSYVTFTLDGIAGVVSEALASMAINANETTSSASSYTVTAGKTLRLTSISAAVRATAATALTSAKIKVRTAASAISITSPILVAFDVTPPNATAASGATGWAEMSFPDGLDIAATHQIGITQLISSTSSAVTVTLVGFEY